MKTEFFNKQEWCGPKQVSTPDIEVDIENYLGCDILAQWRISSDPILKEKIKNIAERLDLIKHLKITAKTVEKASTNTFRRENNETMRKDSRLIYKEHDFGGFQYDIEALVFYLYMSCLDTIQSQPQYKSPFEYLQEKIDVFQQKDSEKLKSLLEKENKDYSETYGLRKNFIKAFTHQISKATQNTICENIMIVKFQNNEIDQKSLQSWLKKDQRNKLKK